ncbi:CYTH domain-containing protein [Desulforhopalus vacuolatus]|uniref:CYTH domain-containing protein n=1 Tax=Desulforhopalus vacuolatus TaxID=40414 RepID=UPI0019630BF8|nr:CYTH domain-containing protein [Desulforhopalus vacuolatus]MBM9519234.1 CYTH domain-containing protein [Desulforhopalus vacuolatus]
MGYEIEKKFLLRDDSWQELGQGHRFRQGYLSSSEEGTVRIRTSRNVGWITVKGPTVNGVRREYEYEIPVTDALQMLKELCIPPIIEKTRYIFTVDNFVWEVDSFLGENEGLVVAEIELDSPDQPFPRPAWLGKEVTDRPRYYNASLVHYPFSEWTAEEKDGE